MFASNLGIPVLGKRACFDTWWTFFCEVSEIFGLIIEFLL